ncbi:MAG: hypothetical protein NVSMB4_00640 [Acidimicrobiales bacterium]
MSLSIQNRSGDGINDYFIDTIVVLPDSGSSVTVGGMVALIGGANVLVTGSPLTAPAVPGSGSTFWNIQIDGTTGAATVQQSPSADPPAINANNIVIFRQTLTFAVSSAALTADTSTTPDQSI